MPNPTLIHPRSVKLEHHLKIVDFYINAGCPAHFLPEPILGDYRPDVYMKDSKGNPICVEVQLTPISTKKMNTKISQFTSTYGKEHDSKVMILCSNTSYGKVEMPKGFHLVRMEVPNEIYCN